MENYSNATTLDMIFEHRNKAYGAYDLHKSYQQNLTKAVVLGVLIFASVLFSPLIFNVQGKQPFICRLPIIACPLRWVQYAAEKVKNPNICYGKPPKTTFRFLPPVVKPDKEVCDEYRTKKEKPILITNICPISIIIDSTIMKIDSIPPPPKDY